MIDTKKIKALMGANDYTRKYVAKHLDLSPTSFKKKLDGKVDFKFSEVVKLAELFGVTVDELKA